MTNEERDIITQFIARVGGMQAGSGFGGSVPATAPALPPVDREADTLIGDLFTRYPEARYRMTQLAFVQEHALSEAQNRIQRLEADLQQARAAQPPQGANSGGFFSGLFGGRPQSPPPQGGPGPVWNQGQPNAQYQPPPQQPQYAPGYQPGMFQRQGSGFLGSALSTAAGVTGGMLAANALMSLFSGPHYGGGFAGGYPAPGASPWGASPDQGYVDQGSWSQNAGGAQADPGAVDSGTWDNTGGGDPGSLADNSDSWDAGGGGFDPPSGGSDDDSLI